MDLSDAAILASILVVAILLVLFIIIDHFKKNPDKKNGFLNRLKTRWKDLRTKYIAFKWKK